MRYLCALRHLRHHAGIDQLGANVPIPDYQTLMAPSLQSLSDGQPKTTVSVRDIVAERLGVLVSEPGSTGDVVDLGGS
jgi:hypothetical protein